MEDLPLQTDSAESWVVELIVMLSLPIDFYSWFSNIYKLTKTLNETSGHACTQSNPLYLVLLGQDIGNESINFAR